MKQISGYVLVKETNSGVPNLVVTAYDSEKSIQEIVASRGNERGFSLRDVGKRIGSVLTDQDGKFVLKSEDLEFQGNESRPDLLIVIFAPEDIQNMEEPYPLPPGQRVLYISTVPREDAGAEEAFFIRLLQAQLDHFRISVVTATGENETDRDRLANAIENTRILGDRLREKLKPRLREEQKKSEEFRRIAQAKVRNLSAIPLYLRDGALRDNQLFINGKKDLADNLEAKQEQAVTDGLERFQTRNPLIRLTLTTEDLKGLGLEEDRGKIIGKVDSDKLTEKVRSLTKGFDLVRLRGFNNPSPEELEQKYLVGKPAPVEDRARIRRR